MAVEVRPKVHYLKPGEHCTFLLDNFKNYTIQERDKGY